MRRLFANLIYQENAFTQQTLHLGPDLRSRGAFRILLRRQVGHMDKLPPMLDTVPLSALQVLVRCDGVWQTQQCGKLVEPFHFKVEPLPIEKPLQFRDGAALDKEVSQ